MEPNSYIQNSQNPNKWTRKQVMALLAIVSSMLVLFASWNIYQATYFRMTGTAPKLNNVNVFSPYIEVKFNQAITDKNFKLSDPSKLVESRKFDGTTLRLGLKPYSRQEGKTYTITIDSITSKNNKTLTNKKLTFVPKTGDFESLTPEEQQASVNQQDRFDYSPTSLPIEGEEALVEKGVSYDQSQALLQAIYNYSKSVNKEFKLVRVYKTSINPLPYDKNNPEGYSSIQFTIDMDDTSFLAQIDCYGDLSTIRLILNDTSTNALVYDSGKVKAEGVN